MRNLSFVNSCCLLTNLCLVSKSFLVVVCSCLLLSVAHAELPTGGESILIVDDEVDLLQLADQYLSDLGYRTRTMQEWHTSIVYTEKI